MNAIEIEISKLKLDSNNTRIHSDESIKAICRSLKKFGQYKPLVVQKSTMTLAAGNGTCIAANLLGWKKINCYLLDLTNEQFKRLSILDNRSSELGMWDEDVLCEILVKLDGDLQEITCFSDEEVENLINKFDDDELAKTPAPAIYIGCKKCGHSFLPEEGKMVENTKLKGV